MFLRAHRPAVFYSSTVYCRLWPVSIFGRGAVGLRKGEAGVKEKNEATT